MDPDQYHQLIHQNLLRNYIILQLHLDFFAQMTFILDILFLFKMLLIWIISHSKFFIIVEVICSEYFI